MNTGSFCYTLGFESHARPGVCGTAGSFTIALSGEFAAFMETQLGALPEKTPLLSKKERQNFSELLALSHGRHPSLPHFSRVDACDGVSYSFGLPTPAKGRNSEDKYLQQEVSFLAFFLGFINGLATKYIEVGHKTLAPGCTEQSIRVYAPWEHRLHDGFVIRFSKDFAWKLKRRIANTVFPGKTAYGNEMIDAANSILVLLPDKSLADMTDVCLYAEYINFSIYGKDCRMLASAETGFRLVARNASHPVQIAALLAAAARLFSLVGKE